MPIIDITRKVSVFYETRSPHTSFLLPHLFPAMLFIKEWPCIMNLRKKNRNGAEASPALPLKEKRFLRRSGGGEAGAAITEYLDNYALVLF